MKEINKAAIWILFIVLVSLIAAAQDMYDPEAEKAQDTIDISLILDQADSLKEINPGETKRIIRSLDEKVPRMGLDSIFRARIEALKKEVGYNKFDSIDFGKYVNPTRHPVTWSISGALLFGLLMLFFVMRRKKILNSMDQLKRTYLGLKKTKAMFEEIDKCVKGKEEYINKNKEYLSRMINLVKENSLPALFGKEATELTKNWAREIKNNIIKRNRKIMRNVRIIRSFTEKQLPAEQGKLLRSLEEDANRIRAIEHKYGVEGEEVVGPGGTNISDQRKKFVDSISKVYAKNKEIRKALDVTILPYQKKIVDYLSSIYASVVNEEKSVIAEDNILLALSKKKVKGVKLKEAIEELIIFNKRKIEYYEFQVKKHDEFMKLLQTDEQMLRWMKMMELAQKKTMEEADFELREEAKLALHGRQTRPLRLIRVIEKRYGKDAPREIHTLTELYDIVGPDKIGDEAFWPLLIRKADEAGALANIAEAEREKDNLKREIKNLERRLRHANMPETERKIIATREIEFPEDIEDQIEAKKEELEKKEKEVENIKTRSEAVRNRNYPGSELNDIGTWLIEEFEREADYHDLIRPLAMIVGRFGPDDLKRNILRIKEYLEKYFPHLTIKR